MANNTEKQKRFPRTKRVFINNIDSHSSKHLATYLSNCAARGSFDGSRKRFQIVGTITSKDEKRKRFALEVYTDLKRDELFQHLMKCDVIVYNISEDAEVIDEATWVVSALHSEMEHFKSPKMFILVSTLMTWASIKPADPDNPKIPVLEEDYIRRRPHPMFREHISAEKLVLKLGKMDKTKLRTYVIGAGMQYGMGESMLHFFFKACWTGDLSSIPIPEPSTNVIPTIHVYDLASVLQNVIICKPKMHYVIAVDDSHNSLEEIVKAIAYALGPGKVHKVPNDNVHLTKEFSQTDLACLSINLLIETVLLHKNLNVRWICDTGLVENIGRVVEEYRQSRRLLPINICLLGPPAVGKSSVAAQLCKHYKLHHIDVKEAVEEKINQLEEMLDQSEVNDETEENVEVTQKELNTLKDILSTNQGQHDDQIILHIIRDKLDSKSCRNQGFVLDGYPCTYKQANILFNDKEMESTNFRSNLLPHDVKIIPDYIFSLDATDEFLKERVQNLPQSVAEEMHYTKNEFLQRLSMFRDANAEVEDTVLDYFDELEIHPIHIKINSMNDPENKTVIEKIIEVVGGAQNYGPTPEEKEEQERNKAVKMQQRLLQDAAECALREAEEEKRMASLLEEWNRNRMEVKMQEDELLEARSLPMRHYLMKYVMPTVKDGLMLGSQLKPDDPIDFLAEYLFKHNTED